ncbi:MAG: hypothetical protein PHW40_05770 [Candidatus Izemoplasmatales bacterium]|jgi:hypothetical protein|nr:hypothetical protein [Candidatus Izemoplasmatales bacterium]
MMQGKKPKIYSEYEIRVILFYATMILALPNVLVLSYIFDFSSVLDIYRFMFWVAMVVLALTIAGTLILWLNRDHYKRRVKASYRGEFIYLLFQSAFGLLGIAVLYDYLGGSRQYIANVMIIVFAAFFYLLYTLGRKYFKFDYMKKR